MFLEIQEPGLLKGGLRLLKNLMCLISDYFEKTIAKKNQKQQFVSIPWPILRPKPATLSKYEITFQQTFFSIVHCSFYHKTVSSS